MARGTGVTATINAAADVLDLMHRLPRTWAMCESGAAEIHIARRVATLSRHLSAEGLWDWSTARCPGSSPTSPGAGCWQSRRPRSSRPTPALHEERVEAERRRRYVSSSRTDEFGLRTIIARCEAGDAMWVEAIVARVAEIIAPRFPDATADEVRSIAFGWLARPAELLQLLLEHRDEPEELDLRSPAGPPLSRPTCSTPCAGSDLSSLAPKAVLYVHLHEAAVAGRRGSRPGRGLRPGHLDRPPVAAGAHQLTIKPVLDLSDRVRATAYEHPESLKERVHLTTDGDYWPFATSTSRRVDYDHPTPYQATGSAGPDRHPQLRSDGPATSPVEDTRRLSRPTVRPRPVRLADPARARLPRRPPRDPPDQRERGTDDARRSARRGHLSELTPDSRVRR